MLSIKILGEHYCDLNPKTSVSVDESLNGSRQSAALKRRSVNGPICLELLSFRSSLMIKWLWRFSGEGPTAVLPAGGFLKGDRFYAVVSV